MAFVDSAWVTGAAVIDCVEIVVNALPINSSKQLILSTCIVLTEEISRHFRVYSKLLRQ